MAEDRNRFVVFDLDAKGEWRSPSGVAEDRNVWDWQDEELAGDVAVALRGG